jgi:arsenite methyltransferase
MGDYLKTNYDLNDVELVSVIDELPLWSAPFGLRLLEKIKYKKNITALDIGSGFGFPLLEVAMRLGNSCKVYGIDPWEAAVQRIKTKINIYRITNTEIRTGVAEKILLPDNSVDLIFSNNGLNNVGDLDVVLNECSRISKIDSQLIFTFNTEKTMIEFYSVLEDVLHEKGLSNEIDLMKNHIYKKRKPPEMYVRLLTDRGYEVKDVSKHEFEYCFVDGSTMFNHFLIKLAFIESWKEIIPEGRQNEIFAEIEKRLNRLAENEGVFKLSVPYVLINAEKIRNNN